MSTVATEVTPLMQEVIRLIKGRINIYYHRSSETHIVCQKPETVFTSFPIKGTADFADVAFANLEHKLVEALAGKSDDELRDIAKQCEKIEPLIDRPSEISP